MCLALLPSAKGVFIGAIWAGEGAEAGRGPIGGFSALSACVCGLRSSMRTSSHIAFSTASVTAKPRPRTHEKYHIGLSSQ